MSAGTARQLGMGIGWRSELALFIDRQPGLGFVELVAEDFPDSRPLPGPLDALRRRGVQVVPHGLTLSLGGAEPPDADRLSALASLASRVGAPLVSEHIAFVRAGGAEAGHLLPVARTREMLRVVVENVRMAQAALPVPLALENIASIVEWPGAEMGEAEFLGEVLGQTGAMLLLDVENLYANSRNHGWDAMEFLDRIPLDRIAYVHVAGGVERDGLYHDTHSHAIPAGVLELLEELCARAPVPGVLLERDDDFPPPERLAAELKAIKESADRGRSRRESVHVC